MKSEKKKKHNFFENYFLPFLGNGACTALEQLQENGVGGAKEEVAFLNMHTLFFFFDIGYPYI